MDRTHWFGCWTQHHDCALARLDLLEQTLRTIKELALEGMNQTPDFQTQLQFNRIIFETDRMETRE